MTKTLKLKARFGLRYDREWDQWIVQVRDPWTGKIIPDRCYYASDRDDAVATLNAMIEEEERRDS